MPTSDTNSPSKTLTVIGSQSQTGSVSPSGRDGASPVRRRRTKVTNEKKIADDEFMAAAIGDVEWLKQSLRENGQQVHFDKNGLSALHLAAIHGRLECLKLCLEKFKQDVNLASSTGWRPVHLSISKQTGKRSLLCLAYLLEKEADPSVGNDDGFTPAHQAASEGHVECLTLLIEAGAKIDGKDCRGNTPFDLAKLWAHRKCARILASEMWHQDKDNVAKEMHQLKRLKMQQVLRELEEEQKAQLDQQFYGQMAYEQWLSSRGLELKPTGSNSVTSPPKEMQGQLKEVLMRPNSLASYGQSVLTAEKGALTMAISAGKKSSASSKVGKQEMQAYIKSDDQLAKSDHVKEKKVSAETINFVNPSSWNLSTSVPSKDYVTILQDDYPRDEYTLMHKSKGAKKYFDGKHATDEKQEDDPEELKKKKLRQPRLSKDIVQKVLSRDPTLYERPIVFKTQHIYDIRQKHKYPHLEKPISEVPFHLCNDLTSQMVKMSLLFSLTPSQQHSAHYHKGGIIQSSSASSSSLLSEAVTDWNAQEFSLPALQSSLK